MVCYEIDTEPLFDQITSHSLKVWGFLLEVFDSCVTSRFALISVKFRSDKNISYLNTKQDLQISQMLI